MRMELPGRRRKRRWRKGKSKEEVHGCGKGRNARGWCDRVRRLEQREGDK